MMKPALRKKIEEYNQKNKYGITDDELAETIIEVGEIKKEYAHDKHRWYTMFKQVKEFEGIFIEFSTYENSGDEPAFDKKDWHKMILDSVIEVVPKEITIIDYVPLV